MRYVVAFAAIIAVQTVAFGQCANGSCAVGAAPQSVPVARLVAGAPLRTAAKIRAKLPHPIRNAIERRRTFLVK